jgi:hypothetical protein
MQDDCLAAVTAVSGNQRELDSVVCADCGGRPIPGGSTFLPIAFLERSILESYNPFERAGCLCELCLLMRFAAQIERWISEVNARGKDAVALPPSRRMTPAIEPPTNREGSCS